MRDGVSVAIGQRLQWGRRLASTETSGHAPAASPRRARFNGAVDSHRRRRAWSARSRSSAAGFNGAVDSHRRRRTRRPRSATRASRFNGAVDSHRRRQRALDRDNLAGGMLQWGRRLASTETRAVARRGHRAPKASMGPSTRIDGDSLVSPRPPLTTGCFNGAVDSHRRRPPSRLLTHCGGACFNGAVDSHRRRPRRGPGGSRSAVAASMGPSTRIDGDMPRGPRSRSCIARLQWGRRLASTETARRRRWSAARRSLQWGRRLASTETCAACLR